MVDCNAAICEIRISIASLERDSWANERSDELEPLPLVEPEPLELVEPDPLPLELVEPEPLPLVEPEPDPEPLPRLETKVWACWSAAVSAVSSELTSCWMAELVVVPRSWFSSETRCCSAATICWA